MTSSVVLDDHLLLLHLAGRDPWLPPGHRVATTSSWWFRLVRASERTSGGSLSALLAALPADDRDRIERDIRRPPAHVAIAHPREIVPQAAALSAHHGLNLLAADALATALAVDGRIVVAAGDDGPRLRATAARLRVPYDVVDP